MAPRVVLVGPMGSGKSAVGALLAVDLGVVLRDTDADVEAAAGAPVAAVFAAEGEAGFRARERDAVLDALREHDGVLALGGGAVLDAATRAALTASHAPVVLLTARWEDVRHRFGDVGTRPLLADPALAQQRWEALADARRHLYAEVADHAVATDGLTAREVADAVLPLLSP